MLTDAKKLNVFNKNQFFMLFIKAYRKLFLFGVSFKPSLLLSSPIASINISADFLIFSLSMYGKRKFLFNNFVVLTHKIDLKFKKAIYLNCVKVLNITVEAL